MPFDGTQNGGLLAVYMIDQMIEMFDGGKNWCGFGWGNGEGHTEKGTHCIVGAMMSIRASQRIKGDRTSRYIRQALDEKARRWCGIMQFNDNVSYTHVHRVLLRARELAVADQRTLV
jgi:hypothetical protein